MPTPFYHISLAEELLEHQQLPVQIQRLLLTYQGEFMFGNTAPDVQVVSGQPREATHFFSLPIRPGDWLAWDRILSMYPKLAIASKLNEMQLAFVAGYLCHLQADWIWVKEIFTPIFGPKCSWGTFRQRLYYHNVLRAYLDLNIPGGLPNGMSARLSKVSPQTWLPFVKDRDLEAWRDVIVPQIQPGEAVRTVEVFSSRLGVSAHMFYDLLKSEDRMQREIFSHFSLAGVEDYKQRVLEENKSLLTNYLAFTLHHNAMTVEGCEYRGVQP
jgi:hypothetical protein